MPPSGVREFSVLAYNAFLRPASGFVSFADGQLVRARMLAELVLTLDADCIVFSELFDDRARALLLEGIRSAFPYQSSVVDELLTFEDGGVVIVSRWPLEDKGHHVFAAATGSDALAAKGVKYVVIHKEGRRYHLFGAHMQARDPSVRDVQRRELRRFLDSRGIPSWEPVILGGDFNTDMASGGEFGLMLTALRASFPRRHRGHRFTYDPSFNDLIDGGAHPRFIDYVLTSDDHLPPTRSSLETVIFRSEAEWREGNRDLSDHFGVRGRFAFHF